MSRPSVPSQPQDLAAIAGGAPRPADPSGLALWQTTRRRISRVGWTSATSGALVTFIAVGFFIPLVGAEHEQTKLALLNAPLIAVYVLLSGLLLQSVFARHARRALAWLLEDRPPDEVEHRLTLALPAHVVKLDAVAWVIGGAAFSLLNGIVQSWGLAAVVAATIWLGGETTCALGYLLYERTLRPVTARALAARPAGPCLAPGVRVRLAMAWLLGTGVPLVGLLVLGLVGAFGWVGHPQYVGAAVLFLAVVATLTGFMATALAARAIADPLTAVRRGLERVVAVISMSTCASTTAARSVSSRPASTG